MLSLSLYSHQVWYGMLRPKSEKKEREKEKYIYAMKVFILFYFAFIIVWYKIK